jgi:16S rRNA (guanine966-N2)-methyltransferase
VTRIIGGRAGGRRLETPRGGLTRPTSDRVREALFSALQSTLGSLEGLRFLDLYAGSGAVGLEAWSRGAAAVTFVEQDRRTAGLIRANARRLGFTEATVVAAPVRRILEEGPLPATQFDVAFLDPPYVTGGGSLAEELLTLAGRGWLAEEALVVVERSARAGPLHWAPGYTPNRVRTYGETVLITARWNGAAG